MSSAMFLHLTYDVYMRKDGTCDYNNDLQFHHQYTRNNTNQGGSRYNDISPPSPRNIAV